MANAKTGELVRAVDAGTGELQHVPSFPHDPDETPLSLRDQTWLGQLTCTKEQDQVLRGPLDEEREVDILPSGELYMPHVFVRRRLNEAFMQQGGWKLRPMSKISIDPDTHVMYREYALVVAGVAVASAYGANKYQPDNKRMDFADSAEAVRSNALTRCAKDLGIGSECWERDWCDRWRDKYAVHVWVEAKDRQGNSKRDHHWRKISRKPFYGETGVVPDSPNFEAAKRQQREHAKMLADRRDDRKAPAKAEAGGGESSSARARQEAPRSSQDQTRASGNLVIPPEQRGFYIKGVRASRIASKPHEVEMMDGMVYFTYHRSVHDAMQLLLASRTRVKITAEAQRSKGKMYPHIVEWMTKNEAGQTMKHMAEKKEER